MLLFLKVQSFRILQNNKTLKLNNSALFTPYGFRILQNNKTLKRQITLKNTMLPHGYFVSVIIVGQDLNPINLNVVRVTLG